MAEGEEADDTQKTEEPTPKKLEEARRKGQVALSREVNNWVMLLTGTVLLMAMADSVLGDLGNVLKVFLEQPHNIPPSPGGMHVMLGETFRQVVKILALPLIILMLAAFLAPFVQVGPLFAPEVIRPDIGKISPFKGLQRLFSARSLMEFAKGVLKIFIIGMVGTVILFPFYGQVEHMVGLPFPLLLEELQTLAVRLMIGVLVVLIVVAVIDVTFQRFEHHRKMRMTKQELKDEYKQTEGDPHVRARLRQLRSERARQRMIQAVPEADVVITNPTHFSVALKYEPGTMDAPVCIAKGIDDLALRIREVAREHNVILYENRILARTLYETVDIDEMVPPEHYRAVAEVISYVFKLQGKLN